MQKTYIDKNQNIFEIRPITADDKKNLRDGLHEMSLESTRQRFQSGKTDFSEAELKQLTEVDQDNHIAFVAIFKNHDGDHPAGVIRGVRDEHRSNFLELAITIVDQYQHRGLGPVLMDTLAKKALNCGYTHFCGDLHNSNLKMLKLLQKFAQNSQDLTTAHVGEGYLYFELKLMN